MKREQPKTVEPPRGIPRVSNLNGAKNQFIIEYEDTLMFQSYGSIIAIKTPETTFIDSYYWDYSTTTGRYRNIFLGETKQETQEKINNGRYTLTNLNK